MTVVEKELSSVSDLPRHVFTRDEYYRMAEAGLFDDERVELIEGDIVIMPPPGPQHRKTSLRLYNILYAFFGKDHYVLHESPIVLADISEPIPDVCVAIDREEAYDNRHPDFADTCLAVEVSDSSPRKDRKLKQRLYAGKGIREYWIVNLVAGQVEVYRQPTNSGYAEMSTLGPEDVINPLFAPDVSINLADFLALSKPQTAVSNSTGWLGRIGELQGSATDMSAGEDPDDYVKRLREGWK